MNKVKTSEKQLKESQIDIEANKSDSGFKTNPIKPQKNRGEFISSIITVGGYTLLYRLSSILRDMMIAAVMGASALSDAFAVVFKLANVLRKVFSEGAFNASFLPKFTYVLKERGKSAANLLASQVFTLLFLVLTTASIVCIWQFAAIIMVYAPKFIGTEKFQYAIELGRLSFPYVGASFIVALFSGILNSVNKFALPTASHLLLNVFVIASLFFGTSWFGTSAHNVAVAVCLAGLAQSVILWGSVRKSGFKIRLTKHLISPDVKEVFLKMLPGAVGAGVWQINMLVDVCMASQLATGCVSYLYYMDHMNQFPLGILGISLSTGLLPYITTSFKEGKYNNASYQLNKGMLFSIAVSLPITALALSIPETLTSLFYEGGKFTKTDVINAAPCLCAFALGLPAYTLTKLCSTAFFAQKNTRTPLISGVIAILVNYIFILLLSRFQHTGIALATTIAAWFNGICLYVALIREGNVSIFSKTIFKLLKQCFLALMIGAVAYFIDKELQPLYVTKLASVLLILALISFCSVLFYWAGKKISCFNIDNQQ